MTGLLMAYGPNADCFLLISDKQKGNEIVMDNKILFKIFQYL